MSLRTDASPPRGLSTAQGAHLVWKQRECHHGSRRAQAQVSGTWTPRGCLSLACRAEMRVAHLSVHEPWLHDPDPGHFRSGARRLDSALDTHLPSSQVSSNLWALRRCGINTAPQNENTCLRCPSQGTCSCDVTFMSPGALQVTSGFQDPCLTDGETGKMGYLLWLFVVLCFVKSENCLLGLSSSNGRNGKAHRPFLAWTGVKVTLTLTWIPRSSHLAAVLFSPVSL